MKRERARLSISNRSRVGSMICKEGKLRYFGARFRTYFQDVGQTIGFLEDFSEDGYQIKFRVKAWATVTGRLQYAPAPGSIIMDGFTLNPGTVYWDKVDDWHLCS